MKLRSISITSTSTRQQNSPKTRSRESPKSRWEVSSDRQSQKRRKEALIVLECVMAKEILQRSRLRNACEACECVWRRENVQNTLFRSPTGFSLWKSGIPPNNNNKNTIEDLQFFAQVSSSAMFSCFRQKSRRHKTDSPPDEMEECVTNDAELLCVICLWLVIPARLTFEFSWTFSFAHAFSGELDCDEAKTNKKNTSFLYKHAERWQKVHTTKTRGRKNPKKYSPSIVG